jgi:hypothetical protein
MTTPSSPEHVDRVSGGAITAVIIGNIILIVAAIVASFFGRFLAFGVDGTTLSESAFMLMVQVAVYGPAGVVIVSVLWGIYRLNGRKSAWWIAGLGLVALAGIFAAGAAAAGW